MSESEQQILEVQEVQENNQEPNKRYDKDFDNICNKWGPIIWVIIIGIVLWIIYLNYHSEIWVIDPSTGKPRTSLPSEVRKIILSIIPALFVGFGIFPILYNWLYLYVSLILKKTTPSLIPLAGGLITTIGLSFCADSNLRKLKWLPLFLDYGCAAYFTMIFCYLIISTFQYIRK